MRRGFSGDLVFASARRALAGWGSDGAPDAEASGADGDADPDDDA